MQSNLPYAMLTKMAYHYVNHLWELLGPPHRYFESNCGRYWNDVYSDMRNKLKGRSFALATQDYTYNVALNTWRGKSGKIYADGKYGTEEVSTGWHYRTGFYVEPETGILRKAVRQKERPKKVAVERVPINANEEYRNIKGQWYYFKLGEKVTAVSILYKSARRDAYNRPVFERTKDEFYVILEKRQLCKKELKSLRERIH